MGYVNSNIEKNIFEDIIEQYYHLGLSFIPVRFNSKKPPLIIRWQEYQKRPPDLGEIYEWLMRFELFNVGLITGYGGFYSLDIDEKEGLKNLPKELLRTTITETKRGYHISFRSDKKLRTKKITINGVKVEFKGLGAYMLEFPSMVEGFQYRVINPISEIKKLPAWLEEKVEEQEQKQTQWQEPKYKGEAKCIKAIWDRELVEGEREISLFILYNLLIKHNAKEYAIEIVKRKNSMLKNPLKESELRKCIFENKEYQRMGCKFIRDNLSYITQEICNTCEIERGRVKASLGKAFNDDRVRNDPIALGLLYYATIEDITNLSELASKLKISKSTASKKMKKLKEWGYLNQYTF